MRGAYWTPAEEAELRAAHAADPYAVRVEGKSGKAVTAKLLRLGLPLPSRLNGLRERNRRRAAALWERAEAQRDRIRTHYSECGSIPEIQRRFRIGQTIATAICRDLIDANEARRRQTGRDPLRRMIAAAYRRDNPGVLSIKEQWHRINRLIEMVESGKGDSESARHLAKELKQNYLTGQQVVARMQHLPVRNPGLAEASDRWLGECRARAGEGAVPEVPGDRVEGAGGLVR